MISKILRRFDCRKIHLLYNFHEDPTSCFSSDVYIVKTLLSRNAEDPYPDVDDLQNLISSSLITDTSLENFFMAMDQ